MLSVLYRYLFVLALALPGAAVQAQNGPVVVELFTSQGCSSCPPADKFLAEIAGRDDVLALSYHVDYWDRLGWKDTMGSPLFTARQYDYRRSFNTRSVWTPQFVVQGMEYSRRSFREEVAGFVKNAQKRQAVLSVAASVQGGNLIIEAQPLAKGLPEILVSLVGYSPSEIVSIKRGENAGRKIAYANTVTSWANLTEWTPKSAKKWSVPLQVNLPVAVLFQASDTGPILASAVVR